MTGLPHTANGASDGLDRAARLMRSLGTDAHLIWNCLTREEVHAISARMNHLPTEDLPGDLGALEAFVRDARDGAVQSSVIGEDAWARLAGCEPATVAALVAGESLQVAAFILGQLPPRLAARTLRLLSRQQAQGVLRRLIHLVAPARSVQAVIAQGIAERLDRIAATGPQQGPARLARIFDQMDRGAETALLDALDTDEPGAGAQVRAMMFTFDDLAGLDAAGLQTLLSKTRRETLALALKNAGKNVSGAFFANMTQRAGDLIREEIRALGPVRRSEIEAARRDLAEQARGLVECGEIRLVPDEDDELVE